MDRTVTFKQEETSGHEPHPELDTKTDRLTDRQSQCDSDYFEGVVCLTVGGSHKFSLKYLLKLGNNKAQSSPGEKFRAFVFSNLYK
jgi:hypothetical protein